MIHLIGNPTRDHIVNGPKSVRAFGGTVLYAGLFLARSGHEVTIIGKGDAEMENWIEHQGIITTHFYQTSRTVEFDNVYVHNRREQFARCGEKINLSEVPDIAFRSEAILVGSVLQEVDPEIVRASRQGVLMLEAQGFMRHLSSEGKVLHRKSGDAEAAVRHCDILKVDEAEAAVLTATTGANTAAGVLYQMGPKIVIVTCGERGVIIFDGTQMIRIRAPETDVIDPTGAGDVFGAAFLIKYLQTEDLIQAGLFGSAAAALSMTEFGTAAVPSAREAARGVKRLFKDLDAVSIGYSATDFNTSHEKRQSHF
jgi:sugar/nucleoside kinase (ribokinase family)